MVRQTFPLTCWICGKKIDLTNCNTDEEGTAVHEACYAAKVALENNVRKGLISFKIAAHSTGNRIKRYLP